MLLPPFHHDRVNWTDKVDFNDVIFLKKVIARIRIWMMSYS